MPTTSARYGFRSPLPTEAPDGPGAFLALVADVEAFLDRRATMQLNGARTITASAWWPVPFDTFLSGQSSALNSGNFVSMNTPWSGRYQVLGRAAISGGDIPSTAGGTNNIGLHVARVSDGATLSEVGQYGIRSDLPITIADEITATAGDGIRLELWTAASGRQLSYGGDAFRARFSVRYLGPV